MALVQLTGGAFQSASGQGLNSGYLLLSLSHDELDSGSGTQIAAGIPIKITLDNLGNVSDTQKVWATDVLLPANAFYIMEAFESDGTTAWDSPQFLTVPSGSTYNLGTFIPNQPVPQPLPAIITLQTNGTNNGNQLLENLVSGTNITLSNSGGNTTISASGGPALQVNGTPNGSQTLLNLASGSGISVTDGGSGTVTIANTAQGGSFGNGSGAFMMGPYYNVYPTAISNSGPNAAANEVRVTLFYTPFSIVLKQCSINVQGGSNGNKFSFGYYSLAGSKLIDSGAYTIAGTGIQTNTFSPVTLSAGVYYFAQTSTAGGASPNIQIIATSNSPFLALMNTTTVKHGTAANASSSGVLPATLGTVTADNSTTNFSIALPIFQ